MITGNLFSSSSPPTSVRNVRDHVAVARMALGQGDYHASLRNLNCALYHLENCKGDFSTGELAEMEHLAGKVYIQLRMYKEAERALQNAINLHCGPEFSAIDVIADSRHLAECFRLSHKLEEAETLYKQCVADLKKLKGAEVQLGKAYMGIAQVLIDAKKPQEADDAIRSALNIFEFNGGIKGYWYGRCLMTLARLRFSQGNLSAAEDILSHALEIIQPLIGPQHPLRARALRALSDLSVRNGKTQDCQDFLSRAQAIENFLKDHDR